MIKVKNVSHHYGIRPVLKDVNLEIGAGELVGVMGPNGMGKTTLLGIVAGALWPLEGVVEIDGKRRRGSVEVDPGRTLFRRSGSLRAPRSPARDAAHRKAGGQNPSHGHAGSGTRRGTRPQDRGFEKW